MQTLNRIVIRASPARVFAAAERIIDWPRLLSHYRWVKVFKQQGGIRQVEMAASRNGLPCQWQSEQRLYPSQKKIYYLHTRSAWTQGMEVWWILKPLRGGATEVILTHKMPLSPNFLVDFFRRAVVGHFFVENIAGKTLAGLKRHLEAT